MTFEIKIIGLGQRWMVEDNVLVPTGHNSSEVSTTIVVPEKDEATGISVPPGEHAIKAEVWFGDTLLAQKSVNITLVRKTN